MIIIGRHALQRLRYAPTSSGDHHFGTLGCIVAQTSGSVNGQHEFEELALKVECDNFWVGPQGQDVLPRRVRAGAEPKGEAENGDSQGLELQLEAAILNEDDTSLGLEGHHIRTTVLFHLSRPHKMTSVARAGSDDGSSPIR